MMDIAQIGEALGLATSAVSLTGKAATTAETIKSLFASDKAPDTGEAAQLLNNLASELTAANMMNVQLSETLRILSQELHRQDQFAAEVAQYELFETAEHDLVYRLKEQYAETQPMHYICPVCLKQEGKISYITGEGHHKRCQANGKHSFQFKEMPKRQRRAGRFA